MLLLEVALLVFILIVFLKSVTAWRLLYTTTSNVTSLHIQVLDLLKNGSMLLLLAVIFQINYRTQLLPF